MSGPRTSSHGACTRTWRLPQNAARKISQSFCLSRASARGPSALWPRSRKSSMAHPTASAIRHGSLAHGGKDRHPYPVPLKVYDRTIAVLKTAVQKAKLGQSEEMAAIKRLDDQARRLEQEASGPSVEALFREERASSHQYGGRSVLGLEPPVGHGHRENSRGFSLAVSPHSPNCLHHRTP